MINILTRWLTLNTHREKWENGQLHWCCQPFKVCFKFSKIKCVIVAPLQCLVVCGFFLKLLSLQSYGWGRINDTNRLWKFDRTWFLLGGERSWEEYETLHLSECGAAFSPLWDFLNSIYHTFNLDILCIAISLDYSAPHYKHSDFF